MHPKQDTRTFLHSASIGTWISRTGIEPVLPRADYPDAVATEAAATGKKRGQYEENLCTYHHASHARLSGDKQQLAAARLPLPTYTLCWSLAEPVAMNQTEASSPWQATTTTTTTLVVDGDVTACSFERRAGCPRRPAFPPHLCACSAASHPGAALVTTRRAPRARSRAPARVERGGNRACVVVEVEEKREGAT